LTDATLWNNVIKMRRRIGNPTLPAMISAEKMINNPGDLMKGIRLSLNSVNPPLLNAAMTWKEANHHVLTPRDLRSSAVYGSPHAYANNMIPPRKEKKKTYVGMMIISFVRARYLHKHSTYKYDTIK
jgi:hypothetical protein